jgi:hypothetical protein
LVLGLREAQAGGRIFSARRVVAIATGARIRRRAHRAGDQSTGGTEVPYHAADKLLALPTGRSRKRHSYFVCSAPGAE